jgi:hypothetical protein
MPGIRRALLRD